MRCVEMTLKVASSARSSSSVATTLRPDLAVEHFERLCGRAFEQQFAVGDDGHARAELADVFDDVRGEDDGDVRADGARAD